MLSTPLQSVKAITECVSHRGSRFQATRRVRLVRSSIVVARACTQEVNGTYGAPRQRLGMFFDLDCIRLCARLGSSYLALMTLSSTKSFRLTKILPVENISRPAISVCTDAMLPHTHALKLGY